jgi:hypothetical protein
MYHMEITKFHSSTAVFSVVMKIKIVRKLLLSELQQNTRRQIRRLIRKTQVSMKR